MLAFCWCVPVAEEMAGKGAKGLKGKRNGGSKGMVLARKGLKKGKGNHNWRDRCGCFPTTPRKTSKV